MAVLYTVDMVLNLNWANEDGLYPIADYVLLDGTGDVHLPAIANGSVGNIWWVINNGGNPISLFTTGVELVSLPANTAVCIQLKTVNPMEGVNCWDLAANVNLHLIPALNQMSQIAGHGLRQSYNGKIDNVSSIEYVSSTTQITEFTSGKLYLFTTPAVLGLDTPPDSSIGNWVYFKNGSRGSVTILTDSINTQFNSGESTLVLEAGDACTLMYAGQPPQPLTPQPKRIFEVVNRYSQQSNLLQSALVLLAAPTQKISSDPVDTGNDPQNIITFNEGGTIYAIVLNSGGDSFNTYAWNGANFSSIGAAVATGSNPSSVTTYKVSPIGGSQYLSITNYNSNTFSTYVRSGASFAAVGAPVATGSYPQGITNFRIGSIQYISLLNSGSNTISTYAWSGSAFTSVGSTVATSPNPKAITSFVVDGATYIGVTSLTDNTLSFYLWRATTLVSIGTTVAGADSGMMLSYPIGAANYVSVVNSGGASFTTYRSDDSVLTSLGNVQTDQYPVGLSNYTYNGAAMMSIVSKNSNTINSYTWNGSTYVGQGNTSTLGQPSSVTGYTIGSGTYVSITTQATNRLTTYQWLPTMMTFSTSPMPYTAPKDIATYRLDGTTPAMSILAINGTSYMLVSYTWNGSSFVNDIASLMVASGAQTIFPFVTPTGIQQIGVAGSSGNLFVARWNGSAFVYGGESVISGWSFTDSTCFYINGVAHVCLAGNGPSASMLVFYWNQAQGLFVSLQAIQSPTSNDVTSLTSYAIGNTQYLSITESFSSIVTTYYWNGTGFATGSSCDIGEPLALDSKKITNFSQLGLTYLSVIASSSSTKLVTLKWNATTSVFDLIENLSISGGVIYRGIVSYTIGDAAYVTLDDPSNTTTYKWTGTQMQLATSSATSTNNNQSRMDWIRINNVPYIVYASQLSGNWVAATQAFNGAPALVQIGDLPTDVLPCGITSYQINGVMYLSVVSKTSNTINTYKWVNGAPTFVSNVSTDAGPSWIISYKIGAETYLSVTNNKANTMGTYRWNGVTFSPVGSNLATGDSPQQLVGYQVKGAMHISVSNYTSNDISTYYWNGSAFAAVGTAPATQTGLTGIATYYYSPNDTTYVYASSALGAKVETFSFAKSNFVSTGAPVSTGGADPGGLVSYSINGETYLSLVNTGSSNLSTFKWMGSTAEILGLPIPTGAAPTTLAQYTASGIPTISVVNSGDGSYNTYRWNGTTYSLSGSFKTILNNPFGMAAFTNVDDRSLVSITNPSYKSFATYEDKVASEQSLSPDVVDGASISFTDQDQVIPSVGTFTFYVPNPLPKIYFLRCTARSPFAVVTLRFGSGTAENQSISINNQSGTVAIQVTSTGRVHRLFQSGPPPQLE